MRAAAGATAASKVQAILLHERRLGHTDRATIGGLGAFWRVWRPKLAAEARSPADEPRIAEIGRLLEGYGAASPEERAERLSAALDLLQQLGSDAPGSAADAVATPRAGARGSPRAQPERPAVGQPQPSRNSAPVPAARSVATQPAGAASPAPEPGANRRTGSAGRTQASKAPVSDLDASVGILPGVGPANAEKLARLGLRTVRDVLYHFPARHIDYSDVKSIRELRALGDDSAQTIQGEVVDVRVEPLRSRAAPGQWMFSDVPARRAAPSGLKRITLRVRDHTGDVEAFWLRPQDYMSREFRPGRSVILSGVCRHRWRGDEVELVDPDYEFVGGAEAIHTARIVPVYRKVQGVSERWLRKLVKTAVDRFAAQLVDHLPLSVRHDAKLIDLASAIGQIHFPDSQEILERARYRLTFDELFRIQLSVLDRRREWESGPPGHAMRSGRDELAAFVGGLPYALTGAQRRVLDEIVADLGRERPMSRLLQGEVGSGKTVVAAAALFVAVANGYQAAIMAPTEILAEQHFRTLGRMLGETSALGRPISLLLLTGSLKKAERTRAYGAIERGEVDVVVGTHALIQEGLSFERLGLAVVDEQHRFGVLQRQALRGKANGSEPENRRRPHLLVMTATPIPRSLALTLYGDLDLSVIDELPPGRQEIRTRCFSPAERSLVYEGIREEVAAGRQAFVICPLVEESDRLEAKAATAEHERLSREVYPDLRLGLLHGRMKPAEKDAVMRSFQGGEIDILVSTAVVEVGIDVPNATCMIIEGAERFGLAQLHQFRGRIGRGSERSYCALLSESDSEAAKSRLEVVARTRDGFRLAEEDLRLRGPGEFFGTRQSGLPDLLLARAGDADALEQARECALVLVARDPNLERPEHRLLAERVRELRRTVEQN